MPKVTVKMIKPKPFKRGAMTANLKAAADKAATDMAKDMTVITKGWSNGGLEFTGKVKSRRDSYEITAEPKAPKSKGAEIWNYLDKGTKKNYPITPKKPGGYLRFRVGYKAGSKPNTVTTTASSSFGPYAHRRKVIHPGIKARNWTKLRYEKWSKKIKDYADKGLKLAVKECGHKF
jgi:hypothetical protein